MGHGLFRNIVSSFSNFKTHAWLCGVLVFSLDLMEFYPLNNLYGAK